MHRYLGLAQDVFAVALVFGFPLINLPTMQRLKQFSSSTARLALYRRSVLTTWTFTVAALMLAPLRTLRVVPHQPSDLPWRDGHSLGQAAVSALIAMLFAWILWPSIQCLFRKDMRKTYLKAYQASFIRFMLPVSRSERLWWVLLSITAGVCEELLCRGFLLHYLRGHLADGPSLSLMLAWLLSSMAFGLGHIYQGRRGVIETTAAGLVFGMLAILSGGLALPILMHILIDLRILLIYNPAEDDPADAAALINGFHPHSRYL
ncbi:CPBP family intramembrane glutamic endopeptidase [Dyella sp. M7H15-1]|uniref:CPBP family intramembrane glutamic endopeptidase n=1 Tax=Dyella sp. M7H15-1 TaxID=2501295 RepID=UPI0013E8A488|nr:CPBP family intramembrane glutamic endopeptidase [Dyella sp. M7H15-1]